MKRTLIFLLIFVLCFVSMGTASADGETVSGLYYTNRYTVDDVTDSGYDFMLPADYEVESKASGKISVSLSVATYETMQKLGFTSLKVQYWSGTSWVTDEEVTDQFSYSTNRFGYNRTFTGLNSGYQYRVKVTLRARRVPGEVQDLTITSNSIICH